MPKGGDQEGGRGGRHRYQGKHRRRRSWFGGGKSRGRHSRAHAAETTAGTSPEEISAEIAGTVEEREPPALERDQLEVEEPRAEPEPVQEPAAEPEPVREPAVERPVEPDDEPEPIEEEPEEAPVADPEPEPVASVAPKEPVAATRPRSLGDIYEGSDDPGRRSDRRRDERRRGRRQAIAAFLGGVLVVVGVVGAFAFLSREDEDPEPDPVATSATNVSEGSEIVSTLIFGPREVSLDRGPIWVALVTYDPEADKGSVLYIPAHTAAEVPGRGLKALGEAYSSGGVPLLLVSVENLLNVEVDRYLELSDKDARVLFEEIGEITVDVPEEVKIPEDPDNIDTSPVRLAFAAGPQKISGHLLMRLLYIRGVDVDDVDFGSRQLAFWDGLLEEFRGDGEDLAEAVLAAGGALGESDASPEDHAAFFEGLANLDSTDIILTSLPVEAVSAGDSELYRADEDDVAETIERTVGEQTGAGTEIRVQVLNGNGEPGIGQDVAERLVGEGFRVILGGNAQRLNYQRTLIVTYDSTADGQALAERAKELLGVREVQVSAQQQGIVDLTIVVGKDFLRAS